jgi:hypothetical protein
LFSEKEIAFLAEHFAVVVFEKMHGRDDPSLAKEREAGVFRDAERIKTLNPRVKMLFYLNAFLDNCPYSWREEMRAHPEWLLRDNQGEPIYKLVRGGVVKIPQFDITHPQWQQWWLGSVRKATKHKAIDGIFIDALPQVVRFPERKLKTWGQEKYPAMRAACDTLLARTRKSAGSEAIIINNGLFGAVPGMDDGGIGWLEHVSGAMVEHFGAFGSRERDGTLKVEEMAREIELIGEAAALRKIVLVKGWPGDYNWLLPKYKSLSQEEKLALAKERLEFALAAFLIAAQEYCYFGYSWGWYHDQGWMQWYPEFEKPLGAPFGPAEKKGWVYIRQFKHASVRLDLEHEEAQIDWHD